MQIQRKPYVPSKNNRTGEGGIRLEEGIYELQCDALVYWGIHNSIVRKQVMLKGMYVHSSGCVGDWLSIIPLYAVKGSYATPVNCETAEDRSKHNKKIGKIIVIPEEVRIEPTWDGY